MVKLKKSTKKFIKKPKGELKTISAKKLITQMSKENSGKLVTQSDPLRERYTNPEFDNRNLFFKSEWEKEKKKSFGGFL